MEQAVLSSIVHSGLNITSELNNPMGHTYFESNIPSFDTIKGNPVLHVPTAFNFRGIDGIIAHTGRRPRGNAKPKLFMFPLQITLAPDTHSNSRKKFFDEWETWTESLEEFDAKAEFVWITPKAAKTEGHKKKDLHPAHVEHYVPIEHICKGVWNWYDQGKKSQRITSE
jgi:hypothetical protein